MKGAHGEPAVEAGPAGMGVPVQLGQCFLVTRAPRSELDPGVPVAWPAAPPAAPSRAVPLPAAWRTAASAGLLRRSGQLLGFGSVSLNFMDFKDREIPDLGPAGGNGPVVGEGSW